MLSFFSRKKRINYFSFFNADPDWKISVKIIKSLIGYLNNKGHQSLLFYGWDRKYKNFKGDTKKLLGLHFEDIVFISIYNNIDNEKSSISVYTAVAVPNMIYLEVDEDILFDLKEFVELIRESFHIEYGFVYTGVHGKRSESYLFGQRENTQHLLGISKKSEEDYAAWRNNKLIFTEGKIRDIYRINLLNLKQVNILTSSGRTLKELIDHEEQLGTLEQLSKDLFQWAIPELLLDSVRKKLYNESFLML